MTDLVEQLSYAARHLPSARVAVHTDGMRSLRWAARLPSGWSPTDVELLVLVPPAYPAQAPSGFDVLGSVSVNGNNPAGTGARDLNGTQHQHFCWNPQSALDYIASDGLWRFAQFSERRFAQPS